MKPDPDRDLIAKFGLKFVRKRIRPFIGMVAARIAMMEGVARCEYVEVSQRTGRQAVILFADFADGVRMWFREGEIDAPVFDRWNDRHLVNNRPHPWGSDGFA